MSQWNAIVDAVEGLVRPALADLPAGDDGWSRSMIVGQDLPSGQLPHVSTHSFVELSEPVDGGYGQQRVGLRFRLDLFTRGETQEAVAARLDAMKAALYADTTLGGLVEHLWIAGRGLLEFPGKDERNGFAVLEMEFFE